MSYPVLHYEFNDSNLSTDSSSSGLDLTNTDVTLVTDSERGPVASFNGTTSILTLSSSSVPPVLVGNASRTISFWFKVADEDHAGIVFYNGVNTEGNRWTGHHDPFEDAFHFLLGRTIFFRTPLYNKTYGITMRLPTTTQHP